MPKSNRWRFEVKCPNILCKNYNITQEIIPEVIKGEKFDYIKSGEYNLYCAECFYELISFSYWEDEDEN